MSVGVSMDFSGITEVKIPQGEVTKITETSGSKRVLWEKVRPYCGYFIHVKPSSSSIDEFTSYEIPYVKGSGWRSAWDKPIRNIEAKASFPICSWVKEKQLGNGQEVDTEILDGGGA